MFGHRHLPNFVKTCFSITCVRLHVRLDVRVYVRIEVRIDVWTNVQTCQTYTSELLSNLRMFYHSTGITGGRLIEPHPNNPKLNIR
jgi:hypothetical protein